MPYTYRPITEADFHACLALLAEDGLDDTSWSCLPELWRDILSQGAGQTSVVEDPRRPAGAQSVALGVSAFVTDEFLACLRDMPTPGPARRLLEQRLTGECPLLKGRAVQEANAAEGLNLLILHAHYTRDVVEDEAYHGMARAMMASFFQGHAGYRLKETLTECRGPRRLALHQDGGWRLRSDYAEFYARPGRPQPPEQEWPYLLGLTRAEAVATPGCAISSLFTYTPPRFFFRLAEQRLLWRALEGETDDAIAEELGLSLWTVKKRWQVIYERVHSVRPDLLPDAGGVVPEARRGTEKRRRLLAYLRQHPEELRPVVPPRRDDTAGLDVHSFRASAQP